MTGVTFIDDSHSSIIHRGSSDDCEYQSDDDDAKLSKDFKDKFGTSIRPELGKSFSYKPVGRLSRWEGGNGNPYDAHHVDTIKVKTEKPSITSTLRQFVRPTYDFTTVTIEDIQRVKIMHDRFLNDAQYSFNYSTMLLIASVIAGVGLGQGSSATIIASMLVSPLMGPVTAIAYGTSIGDYKMVRMGLVTEITSLMICIVIGLALGAIMQSMLFLPQDEMLNRGTMENFYCGIPIAFFSGLGVAVGLLDSQTNSLVGVAISASLLPPAVNAGMLWIVSEGIDEAGEPTHYRQKGAISLFLTLMNIAVIIVASMFMFRLKELLPIEKSIFWSDLGVARKIYHNVAFIPKIREAPNEQEIQKRVTRFFPRASAMAKERAPNWNRNSRHLVGPDDQYSSLSMPKISEK